MHLDPPVVEVIAAGGGVKNPVLMQRITAMVVPIPVRRSDDLGVPSDAREAMAFAVLGDLTLRGLWLGFHRLPERRCPNCSASSRSLGSRRPFPAGFPVF